MITPTCYSSRFCARSTYSFSKDGSPANVFEDNRMIWLALRFLKSKKNITISFFFSHEEAEILTMRTCNRKIDLPISHLFSCFFFRPSCKKGNNIVRIFAQSKSKAYRVWVPIPTERASDVNKLYPYLEFL